jgi:hypothetical protein
MLEISSSLWSLCSTRLSNEWFEDSSSSEEDDNSDHHRRKRQGENERGSGKVGPMVELTMKIT